MDRTTDNRGNRALLQGQGREATGTAGKGVPLSNGVDRGGPVWVEIPFPIRIRVKDSAGALVDMESVLDRLSVSDLYLRLPSPLAVGERLPIVVHLWLSPQMQGPRLAVCGTVSNVEPQPDRTYGIAVRFKRHWLLYAV